MKHPTAILLVVCLSSVLAGDHPDGTSKVSRSQDALGNYRFGYTVSNVEGQHYRQEGTDAFGRVVGSYGLSHADGRHRVVDYVADQSGFRARVRSNEPGVENSDTLSERSGDFHVLETAATSNDEDDNLYGRRLKPTSSRVAYVQSDEVDRPEALPPTRRARPRRPRPQKYRSEEETNRDTRQRHLDEQDAGPLQPSPHHNRISIARPVIYGEPTGPRYRPPDSESGAAGPSDVYRPPIDPHTAVRRPTYYIPRGAPESDDDRPATTSRRPFVPPYGGFEDEPLSVNNRYPAAVTMGNIHGGMNSYFQQPTSPTRIYGAGRYPSDPSFPQVPPSYEPYPGGRIALQPPGDAADVFYGRPLPPSALQNLVLRAVPIPNGIQAVRVDPSNGRVYDRLEYPLYSREEGVAPYDRNVLTHTGGDDVPGPSSYDVPGPSSYDAPLRVSRPNLRDVRDRAYDVREQPYEGRYFLPEDRRGGSNVTDSDSDFRLSRPSAKDMEHIQRHLSAISRSRPPSSYGSTRFDDDDPDGSFGPPARAEFNPYAGSVPDYFEREFRLAQFPGRNRRLSEEGSKNVAVTSVLQATDTSSNGTLGKADEEQPASKA